MVRAVIFDFDGVLVESVDIKIDAFRQLFSQYPQHLPTILDYQKNNGGISRVEKLKYFYKNILKEDLAPEKLTKLCDQFEKIVVNQVVASEWVPGALEILNYCLNKYKAYVASGTPTNELQLIVKRRGLEKYFQGVYGSPEKKDSIVAEILNKEKLTSQEVIFIGDSINDFEAAKKSGVRFIARVLNNQQQSWMDDPLIVGRASDMKDALEILRPLI